MTIELSDRRNHMTHKSTTWPLTEVSQAQMSTLNFTKDWDWNQWIFIDLSHLILITIP